MYRFLLMDRTFRELDIPLRPAQRRELEKRIQKCKPVEPVYIWNGYILAGYERYDLCEKHNRTYTGREMYFPRKNEAAAWACREQLKRADLQRPAVCWLLYRLYRMELEKENRKAAKDQFQYKQLSPSQRYEAYPEKPPGSTAVMRAIGVEYKLHEATIRNYVRYGKQLDRLEEMFPGTRIRVFTGEIEIPLMYMDALMELPRDELARMLGDPQCRKLLPPEDSVCRIRKTRDPRYRTHIHVETAIKDTPEYDPDAELNGLSLTIGAWVKVISRTGEKADLAHATAGGKERLRHALRQLSLETDNLYRTLEEETNE